jgi:hypothetical protein
MIGTLILFSSAHLLAAVVCAKMARDPLLLRLLLPFAVLISLYGALVVADSLPAFPGALPYFFGSDGEG